MHIHYPELLRGAPSTSRRLKFAAMFTVAFVLFEVAAGFASHSLSLFSDAAQNLVDAVTLALALSAVTLASKPADSLRTYGYHRVTVLVALVNAFILMPLIFEIGRQAIGRAIHPVPVDGTIVGITGLIGLVCNLTVAFTLKSSSKKLFVRGAYLHNLADAVASILILGSGLMIEFSGFSIIDLAVSGVICAMLVASLLPIVRSSVHILLEGTPEGVDPRKVREALVAFPEVMDIHDLHTWVQGDGMGAMTCHVIVRPDVPHELDHPLVDRVRAMLRVRFQLTHTTIQLEHESCEQSRRCIWGGEADTPAIVADRAR